MIDLSQYFDKTLAANTSIIDTGTTLAANTTPIAANDILQLAGDLKASDALYDAYTLVAPETYNKIRWWHHLGKSPLPRRKLRKCHLRKVYRRRQAERRRYL